MALGVSSDWDEIPLPPVLRLYAFTDVEGYGEYVHLVVASNLQQAKMLLDKACKELTNRKDSSSASLWSEASEDCHGESVPNTIRYNHINSFDLSIPRYLGTWGHAE